MLVETRFITAEELAQMPPEEGRMELVRGELLRMPPAGHEHGEIAGNTFALLWTFVKKHSSGKMYTAETGFTLSRNPDTVRAPDAAFVTAERAARQKRRHGFFDGVPDLAVEVVSPGDTAEEVEEKILDYLEAGVRLLWIVNPRTRTVAVYRSLSDIRVLTLDDSLEGYDVLPGFTVPVREIFDL
jgi:Uma2 family endonuclease